MDAAMAASALAWWADAGVDTLVAETPRDWLKPVAKAAPVAAAASGGDALPDQLDLFQAWLRDHRDLPFAAPAAPRVCPAGDPAAGLMVMSDMPADEDCASGTLLSGAAGRLFDAMLAAIGRDRGAIYLAALSCLRAPGGGLSGDAGARCATLARHHIGLVAPPALLLLGDACAKAMLGLSVVQARGRWHQVSTHAGPAPAIVTFHPETLLRQAPLKAHAWADLQMLTKGPTP